jgi:alpha-glucosidase
MHILQFTLMRQRLDKVYHRQLQARQLLPSQTPGKLIQVNPITSGAEFNFENAKLEIKFLAAELARLTWQPGLLPVPYAIDKQNWDDVPVRLEQSPEGWDLAAPQLTISVKADGGLVFRHAQKNLRTELPPTFKGKDSETSWTARIEPIPGQNIYGLGDQAGPFNLNGSRRQLWNSDPGGSFGPQHDPIYMPLPVVCIQHSGGSYLVFYENSFRGEVDFTSTQPNTGAQTFQFTQGALRYYLIAGAIPDLMERFTELTGRPELPPLWSLGYHQSRWGYKSEADIREVVSGFQEHQLPLSAIHLDIDYMQGFRVFSVDQERYPDLASLAHSLDQQGIKLVPIIDPAVKEDTAYPLYQRGVEKNVFCTLPDGQILHGVVWPGVSAFPDFTNPQTRSWWEGHYPILLDQGMAGIWHDMNEPTSFSAWGGQTLPLSTMHDLEGNHGDHLQAHNLYALQMNRAGYQALKRLRPTRRPWLISRSGWVSQQRYAWKWSGDTESSWGSLRMTIANALGMGLSGQPYTGPDIGGFSGNPNAELYLRWFQMAAFLPFFRTHAALSTARREPWVYGEPFTSIIRKFLQLRYQLLPYFYSLSWQTHQSGIPMIRPLFWRHLQEQSLWGVDDAFMLGDDLLIAPVLQAGTRQRTLQLPPGEWFDFWTDQRYQGPAEMKLPVSLKNIPLLVRAGAILPMVEGDHLGLHVYPPQTETDQPLASLPLYSDRGDGYEARRLDQLSLQRQGNRLTLWWNQQGEYPFPYSKIHIKLHGMQAEKAWLDGKPSKPASALILSEPFQTLEFEA